MARKPPGVQAVLSTGGQPGQAWPTALQAPIGDGSSVSALPVVGFGGAPLNESGSDTPKLGLGTADPTVHGGD